jgi:hypothetical protein
MRIARGGVSVLLCAAALVLTGCTVGDGPVTGPEGSPTEPPGVTAKPTASSEPPPPLEAVIVVANVDVDGAHATASGYVSGVIEDGGRCTFVFTGESQEVRVDSTGAADRATTSCGAVSVPVEQLGKGSWTVTLEYRSDQAEVVSDESTMEVP